MLTKLLQPVAVLNANQSILVQFNYLDQSFLFGAAALCWPLKADLHEADLCVVESWDLAVFVGDAEGFYIIWAFKLYEGLCVSAVDVKAFESELFEGCAQMFLVKVFGEGLDGNGALSHKILYKVRSLIFHKRGCDDRCGVQLGMIIEKQV